MGHIGWLRLCHARLRHFIVLRRISLQMPNSHRPPDKTRRFCMCRVYCAGLNWTIALNVFRRQIFCRRQSSVVGNPIYTADADSTQTRQFCRVWRTGRCELAFRLTATRHPLLEVVLAAFCVWRYLLAVSDPNLFFFRIACPECGDVWASDS